MRKIVFLFLIVLVLPASGAQLRLSFNGYAIGEMPTNFSTALAGNGAPGDWKIVSDEAAFSFSTPLSPQIAPSPSLARRSVLAQLNPDPTDERFPILVYDGEPFKNFKATTQFKIVGGAAEQMAGFVFRYQNASNFYVIRASALGHNVRFYKVVNGARGNLIGPDLNITTNVWHTLAVQCEGNQITFWVDGKLAIAPLHDTSFSAGKIGFWTKSDALSYFGDTMIEYTPVVPAAQALIRDTLKQYPRILGLRIYMPDENGNLQVVASKDSSEIGTPATDAEKNTFEKGAVFYGHDKGTVAVDMPLNDRNGEPVAAVRVQLKSYSLAETQEMVLNRVRLIIKEMQTHVVSKEDLM